MKNAEQTCDKGGEDGAPPPPKLLPSIHPCLCQSLTLLLFLLLLLYLDIPGLVSFQDGISERVTTVAGSLRFPRVGAVGAVSTNTRYSFE